MEIEIPARLIEPLLRYAAESDQSIEEIIERASETIWKGTRRMANGEKKGITVRIDADLHAEVSRFLKDNNMTMAEFVTLALDDELHPKFETKEKNNMANMRTIAVQVPESMFQKIKDYLHRNNITQKEFLIGLIADELERDQTERESENAAQTDDSEQDEEVPEQDGNAAVGDFEDEYDEDEETDPDEDEDEDETEDEGHGFSMAM